MKKGFTLIELLSVIIILAIILVIVVPQILNTLNSSTSKAHISNNKMVLKSTELFVANNTNYLPSEIGSTNEITIQTLIDSNVLKEFKLGNNDCSGYVLITKINETDYDYSPYINCFENITSSSEDGLLLHYSLNNNILDSSLNNNHGNYVGGTLNFRDNYKDKKTLYFSNSRVHTYNLLDEIDNNNITLSAFINREASVNAYNMFVGQLLPYFSFRSNNTIFLSMSINGTQTSLGTSNTFSNNVWYHVVGVYDGSHMKIYVDGELEAQKTASGPMAKYASNLFTIGDGQNNTWYPFSGSISDVRVYKRALSNQEIKKIYEELR